MISKFMILSLPSGNLMETPLGRSISDISAQINREEIENWREIEMNAELHFKKGKVKIPSQPLKLIMFSVLRLPF